MPLTKSKKKKIILIVGPTAIGKTDLSVNIAKLLKTDIISFDSRQFYKELKIGTAPPTKKQLNIVKHHFIHHISIQQEYNVGRYEKEALDLINSLHKNKESIVVVGGSGLYANAITHGLDNIPETNNNIRNICNKLYEKNGIEWLQKKIKLIDPIFYENNDINNHQRLLRVLEVHKQTGEKLSSLQKNIIKKRPFDIIKIGLNTNREILYEKINCRVDNMISDGLIDEVISLQKFQNYNALQAVGYKELFSFLRNEISLEIAINNIKKNTRRFAKRQITWFKKDNEIKWFTPDEKKEIYSFIEE